jgi:integrase/recombinase XerD
VAGASAGRYSDAYGRNQYRALQQFFRWLAEEEQLPDPGRLRNRSASRKRLTPLSSLRQTFAAIVAMNCLICTDVCAD